MCGLVGWISRNNKVDLALVNDYVAEQYENQKTRGRDGYGVFEINEDGSFHIMRATGEVKMMIDLRTSQARHILLHHRHPTSTDNTIDQTHPLKIENKELKFEWYVAHNGVAREPEKLREKHLELGYTYATEYTEKRYTSSPETLKFNDSEAFAIELVRYLEGKAKEIDMQGAAAFFAVATFGGKVEKIYVGSNGIHPLSMDTYQEGFHFASLLSGENDIAANTAIEFFAQYDHKTRKLTGFKRKKEPQSLVFKTAAPVVSTYYDKDKGKDDERTYHGTDAPAMGYARQSAPPAAAPETKLMSYGHILEILKRSELGTVFIDKDLFEHPVMVSFDYDEFARLYREGKLEAVEDLWGKFTDELGEMMDIDGALSQAITAEISMPAELSAPATIKAAKESIGDRMRVVAREFMPVFRLSAFVEAAMSLGYKYQYSDMGDADPKIKERTMLATNRFQGGIESPAERLATHYIAWGPDHEASRCGNVAMHVEEMDARTEKAHFDTWGQVHTVEKCSRPEFHLYDVNEEPLMLAEHADMRDNIETAKSMDDIVRENDHTMKQIEASSSSQAEQEAAVAMETFESASEGMDPDAILQEAEHVSEAVRTAASVGIEEQLSLMASIAAEEGVVFKIPKIEDDILTIISTTSSRMGKVARIVKAALEEERIQERFEIDES